MSIKIEKNVPLAPRSAAYPKQRKSKYPLAKMEVGDSFAMPLNKINRQRVASASYRFGRETNRKFVTCVVPDQNKIRCWRTA